MTTMTQLESRVNSLEEQITKLRSVSVSQDVYKMTKSEQAGVERGLRQSNSGEFATDEQVQKTYAQCGVV